MGNKSYQQKILIPLPLVPTKEGKLIKSTLNSKNVTLKEREQLL